MAPADLAFVMDSWLNSWRKSPWAGVVPNNEYYPMTRRVIEGLIMRGAMLDIACLTSNPEKIVGWICYEVSPRNEKYVHCVYVKDPYIGLGVGRALVSRHVGQDEDGFYTFRTKQTESACRDLGLRHAPEIVRRK